MKLLKYTKISKNLLKSPTFIRNPLLIAEPVPRQCRPVESAYCSNLPYNLTTYPNMLGHSDIAGVDSVIHKIKYVFVFVSIFVFVFVTKFVFVTISVFVFVTTLIFVFVTTSVFVFVTNFVFARSVVDSGCYPLAYELLCQLVQPVCYADRMVKPCQVPLELYLYLYKYSAFFL